MQLLHHSNGCRQLLRQPNPWHCRRTFLLEKNQPPVRQHRSRLRIAYQPCSLIKPCFTVTLGAAINLEVAEQFSPFCIVRRKLILPVRTIREVMPLASCQPAWQKEVLRTRQLVMFLKKKKVEIRIEFRLARDKDQKDVMVSNISDAGGKSQENFSRFFPDILQHQILAYRLVFVHIQFNSFTIRSRKGSAVGKRRHWSI